MREPYSNARRSSMEILCRLAGRSTYVTPSTGGSNVRQHAGPEDIAHALGTSRNELGKAVALAMACQRMSDFPQIQRLAVPMMHARLSRSWRHAPLIEGAKRARVRLVLHDALHDLVFPTQKRAVSKRAAAARMRRSDYDALYRQIASTMEMHAQDAAADACAFLFGS